MPETAPHPMLAAPEFAHLSFEVYCEPAPIDWQVTT